MLFNDAKSPLGRFILTRPSKPRASSNFHAPFYEAMQHFLGSRTGYRINGCQRRSRFDRAVHYYAHAITHARRLGGFWIRTGYRISNPDVVVGDVGTYLHKSTHAL